MTTIKQPKQIEMKTIEETKLNIDALKGKTIINIEGLSKGSEQVFFTTSDGDTYKMYHEFDCCEEVSIEDICGDVEDLLNSPILIAEERTSKENPDDIDKNIYEYQESFTWTFYVLATIKGYVTIRWYGESNGCYSEEVYFEKM